jgi:hypothetical protein
MSSELIPFDGPSAGPSRQVARKAKQAKESSDLEVYRYSLGAAARSVMDQADSWAAHDAAQVGLESELSLLHDGLGKAGGTAAGAELVARWVNQLSNSNHRRFGRRFGG